MYFHQLLIDLKWKLRKNPSIRNLDNKRRKWLQRNRRKALQLYGAEAAYKLIEALEAVGLHAKLYAGSLLGAMREGCFLEHDCDVDVAISVDSDIEWDRVQMALDSAGFTFVHEFSFMGVATEQTYRFRELTLDIFALCSPEQFGIETNHGNRISLFYTRVEGQSYSSDSDYSVEWIAIPWVDGKRYVRVGEYSLAVPENAEEFLSSHYGREWRVPDPNWISGTGYTLFEGERGVYRCI